MGWGGVATMPPLRAKSLQLNAYACTAAPHRPHVPHLGPHLATVTTPRPCFCPCPSRRITAPRDLAVVLLPLPLPPPLPLLQVSVTTGCSDELEDVMGRWVGGCESGTRARGCSVGVGTQGVSEGGGAGGGGLDARATRCVFTHGEQARNSAGPCGCSL